MVKDLKGIQFGRLTVIERSNEKHIGTSRAVRWVCQCECGNVKVIPRPSLLTYGVMSCGCIAKEINGNRTRTHGLSHSKTYNTWVSMLQRCKNQNHPRFHDWGGRGITVCFEWESFENFHKDMGDALLNRSLDRIDNDKGYSKENCRWATTMEQAHNKRERRQPHAIHRRKIRASILSFRKRTSEL